MADLIGRLAAKLAGQQFDSIVGIPRGGLIAAAALAYRLGVTQVSAFGITYQRRPGEQAPTIGGHYSTPQLGLNERVLLVEDGVRTGTLLEYAATWLRTYDDTARTNWPATVVTAALWVSTRHDYRPDVWAAEVDIPPSGASLVAGLHAT